MDKFTCGEKHVAQTYDGTAVMAGEHSGLQSLVKGKYNHAMLCIAMLTNLI